MNIAQSRAPAICPRVGGRGDWKADKGRVLASYGYVRRVGLHAAGGQPDRRRPTFTQRPWRAASDGVYLGTGEDVPPPLGEGLRQREHGLAAGLSVATWKSRLEPAEKSLKLQKTIKAHQRRRD